MLSVPGVAWEGLALESWMLDFQHGLLTYYLCETCCVYNSFLVQCPLWASKALSWNKKWLGCGRGAYVSLRCKLVCAHTVVWVWHVLLYQVRRGKVRSGTPMLDVVFSGHELFTYASVFACSTYVMLLTWNFRVTGAKEKQGRGFLSTHSLASRFTLLYPPHTIWRPCAHCLGIRSRYGSGSRGYLNLWQLINLI